MPKSWNRLADNSKEASLPGNGVEHEFEVLEKEFTFPERMDIARDLFDELSSLNSQLVRRSEFNHEIQYREKPARDDFKHYLLPHIPGGDGDLASIREAYDRRSEYRTAGRYTFIKVGQGEMWMVPKEENPYLKLSISECSAIIGAGAENTVVAHVSYSTLDELRAVMAFLDEHHIPREQTFAVASVGDYQRQQSEKEFHQRVVDENAYLNFGIPRENIKTFSYHPGERTSKDESISHDITQVVINKEGFIKWSFDLKEIFQPGYSFLREEKIGESKDEEVVAFPVPRVEK